VEGREHRHTGTIEGKMAETSSSITVSTKLERIAKLAREMPQAAVGKRRQCFTAEFVEVARRCWFTIAAGITKTACSSHSASVATCDYTAIAGSAAGYQNFCSNCGARSIRVCVQQRLARSAGDSPG
jgi:hypothetical protein